MQLAPAEANALMHLVMKLPRVARSAAMVHDAVHSLRLSSHRVLSDGSEVAPLQVFYLVDEGAKTILIMGVSRPESDQVLLTEGTLRHLISRASSSTSELYDLPATLDISSEGNVRTIGEWIQKASEALRRAS